jgi:hypothetical protein
MDDNSLMQTVAERSVAEELDLQETISEALGFYRRDLADGSQEDADRYAVAMLLKIVDAQIAVAIDRAMTLLAKKAPPPPPQPKEKKPFFPPGFENDE